MASEKKAFLLKSSCCGLFLVVFVFGIIVNTCIARFVNRDLSKEAEVQVYMDELSGFGKTKGVTKSLLRVDVNDDKTPFLHGKINGKKQIWRVEINNVRLKLKSAVPGFKDKYVRCFEALIDPNTGHLLRIRSIFDGNDPNMLPEPPADIAEKEMRGNWSECYHGFPKQKPSINLETALDNVLAEGIGNPLEAKEIHAAYVLYSRMGSEQRAVWSITLRGIPPRPVFGGPPNIPDDEKVPVWQRNHIRNIVDATTGKVLFSTTSPQPLPPKKKTETK
jgi:hypothetical protein